MQTEIALGPSTFKANVQLLHEVTVKNNNYLNQAVY